MQSPHKFSMLACKTLLQLLRHQFCGVSIGQSNLMMVLDKKSRDHESCFWDISPKTTNVNLMVQLLVEPEGKFSESPNHQNHQQNTKVIMMTLVIRWIFLLALKTFMVSKRWIFWKPWMSLSSFAQSIPGTLYYIWTQCWRQILFIPMKAAQWLFEAKDAQHPKYENSRIFYAAHTT